MKTVGRTFNCAKAVETETPQGFEKMTIADLKEYAEAGGIDLGGAKTKAEIIAVISAFDTE